MLTKCRCDLSHARLHATTPMVAWCSRISCSIILPSISSFSQTHSGIEALCSDSNSRSSRFLGAATSRPFLHNSIRQIAGCQMQKANTEIGNMQVGHRNVASTKTLDAAAMDEQPVPIHISHMAFSADGTSMATVDVHPSANASSPVGCSLKFWDRRSSGASATRPPLYSLNSHVANPHRSGPA